jgi:hypothetical protein
MQRTTIVGCVLATAIAVAASQALAQQDEGPILRPKVQPAKLTGPTLLVLCDLACNWKLDGEAKGHIEAGGSAKAKVVLGQHLVVATTEDGLDKVQQLTEVKTAEQSVVNIELQPVRDARLKAEKDAKDKADQEAKDRAAKEERDRVAQEVRDKVAQEEASKTWIDPATVLMWTNMDNGAGISWYEAVDYCHSLKLANHSDWRLPTIDELQILYDPDANIDGWHVRGKLKLTGSEWSNSLGNAISDAWFFNFGSGERRSLRFGASINLRAICVRRSGE